MVEPPELIVVDDDTEEVECDGGGGPLGHPAVWYSLVDQDYVECMYCDRRFVKESARKSLALTDSHGTNGA
jgi:uncharacterized Zn-finger protein